jgi:hypothetical protein
MFSHPSFQNHQTRGIFIIKQLLINILLHPTTDMAELPLTQYIGDLETLRNLLLPSTLLDLVFVAVDFERPQYFTNGSRCDSKDTQVSLAILDTRGISPTSKFTTFNFVTGDDEYFATSVHQYRWGTPERIPIKSMLSRINKCLRVYQNGSIVLVGHGMSSDLSALRALGLDFTQVVVKLDTYSLARKMQMGDFPLKNLLIELKVPCNLKFHNAGTDANVALRALLLLGINAIGATEGIEISERVQTLWWIAMGDVISRRLRKNMHMRRKLAKTWSLEGQEDYEDIREQRRRKREMLNVDL